MKHRLALAGALTILGAVALAPKAQAQDTVTIPFNGTVNSSCTFSGIQTGTLTQPSATAEYLMAHTGSNVGNSGSVTVNCPSGSALVGVSAPVKITAPNSFSPTTVQAVLTDGTNSTTAFTGNRFNTSLPWNANTGDITVNSASANLSVGMVVGREASTNGLPSGTYQYQVTVTATAQ
jgi:hypothetical protein